MSLLEVTDLTKEFGDLTAVDDVSLEVEDGEFVTILGPSGSGKSTILRMVAGFEEPTEGSIVIGGDDVTDEPPFKRDVNMMFQDLALFPHLTVAENIGYGLKQQGVPPEERKERIEDILEVVRLSDYGDRAPEELSGGEQQRVALARAIVNEPKLMLFDEPLGSLDRKLRQHMQFELQRIQAETGITSLYVTHDQEIAMSISDRLILLNEGDIEQSGTVEDLYDRPASQFVADFLGDVNTVSATVESSQNGELTLSLDDTETSLVVSKDDVRSLDEHRTGSSVDLCVRPHNVALSDTDTGQSVPGTVANRIYKGEGVTYLIEAGTTTYKATVEDGDFSIGDDVYLSWDADEAYIFGEE
ncbi:ABC transporter ATP-binding protein [Haloferax sp. YSSS75]|uniref:ABC transporter ATP-binding protein n=1 Tax=Haloferax sp. YSSS75 TaxID=3388564 RepID=UPI00398C8E9C